MSHNREEGGFVDQSHMDEMPMCPLTSCVSLVIHSNYLSIYSIVYITGLKKERMLHIAQSLMQVGTQS